MTRGEKKRLQKDKNILGKKDNKYKKGQKGHITKEQKDKMTKTKEQKKKGKKNTQNN